MASGLASRNDHGFILLLLMVLIMGCWYKSRDPSISGNEMDLLRAKLLKVVQRDFMDLMDEDCLEFVQLCALLGSFYLYHGKPRSSFSILGAATKTAQAMDLHRNSENRWSFEDKEERIRVWWTIYTWDRFVILEKNLPPHADEHIYSAPLLTGDLWVSTIKTATSPCHQKFLKIFISTHSLLFHRFACRRTNTDSTRYTG